MRAAEREGSGTAINKALPYALGKDADYRGIPPRSRLGTPSVCAQKKIQKSIRKPLWEPPTCARLPVMKIRTIDDKNRVTVTTTGARLYAETVNDSGVITLTPVTIPHPPRMGGAAVRAIYVGQMPQSQSGNVTITLHVPLSALGWDSKLVAEHIAKLANEYESAVAINAMGLGGAIADLVRKLTDQQVIDVLPGKLDSE